jgi:hypothetical protein
LEKEAYHPCLLQVLDAMTSPVRPVALVTRHLPTTAATESTDHVRLRHMPTALSHQQRALMPEPCMLSTLNSSPASNGSTTRLCSAGIPARQFYRRLALFPHNARTHSGRRPSHCGRSASQASSACQNDHGSGANLATKRRLWKKTNVSHHPRPIRLGLATYHFFTLYYYYYVLLRHFYCSYFEHTIS